MKKQLWGVLLLVATLIALAGQLTSAPTGGAHTGVSGLYITKLGDGSGTGNGNLWVGNGTPTVTMDGEDAYVEGTFEVDGAARFDGTATFNSAQILTENAVSLTSPTVAFSVTGKNFITLNSNANQTGHYPTGGVVGQVVTVVMGSGSNTARFDDNGTTLALGGNLTLTEGQGDALVLICTGTSGSQSTWSCLSDRSGN